jgi:hypothetical protein
MGNYEIQEQSLTQFSGFEFIISQEMHLDSAQTSLVADAGSLDWLVKHSVGEDINC